MNHLSRALALLSLLMGAACAHTPESHYVSVLETYSAGDEIYEGLENSFSFKATLLNRKVSEEMLRRQADFYDWSSLKIQSEQQKVDDEGLQFTEVFLSFYTPNPKDANLTDANSVWRVYLEVDGATYDAEIQRDRRKRTEIQAMFPYHSQWAFPYYLKFPIPVSQVQSRTSQLTITGPLGKRTIQFRGLSPQY